MKKVVIAGGTHCGKTTLIEHFRSLGYPVVEEAALPILMQLSEEMGVEAYRAWRKTNPEEFWRMIEDAQIENEANAPKETDLLFLDRGIEDTIAMERYVGAEPSERALAYAKNARYDYVFVCDTLPEFDGRGHTGRTFTYEDSLKLTELADAEYRKNGYRPVRLPPASVDERVALINTTIGIHAGEPNS